MKLVRCVAIDDEPLALDLIGEYIKRIPYLDLIGVYQNPLMALHEVRKHDIDLIFLDISMPDYSGLSFLRSLKNPPKVIFTTAHVNHTIEGFELNALDYLLKPFSFERFLKSTERAYATLTTSHNQSLNNEPKESYPEYFFVKSEYSLIRVEVDKITYIEADKEYVKIHTNQEKNPIYTLNSLKKLEKLLPAHSFIRIHRSFMISLDKLDTYTKGRVHLNGIVIPVGETYRKDLETRLEAK